MSPNVVFENQAEAYKLETERLTALANAHKTLLEAAEIGARVDGINITNEIRELGLRRAIAALRRIDADRAVNEREERRLREHGRNLAFYREGHNLPLLMIQKVWAAFKVFHGMTPYSLLESWLKTPVDSEMATYSGSWVIRSKKVKLPDEISNLASLVGFQSENHQYAAVKANSYPHLMTMQAFDAMDFAAKKKIELIKAEIEKIKAGEPEALRLAELLKP
jgi:hypothetical protein